jgi:hypothetical protein
VVIGDTLGFLVGAWTVTRLIEDRRSGLSGSFAGRATLVWAGGEPGPLVWAGGEPGPDATARASYREAGELRYGSYTGPAGRSLEYARLGEAAVMLYFPDGRPFTDLDLRRGRWRGSHLCGADRYDILTVALSRDLVQERWRVRGPAKDYDAVTTLRRAGMPSGTGLRAAGAPDPAGGPDPAGAAAAACQASPARVRRTDSGGPSASR